MRYDKRRKWPWPEVINAKGFKYDGNHSLRQLLRRLRARRRRIGDPLIRAGTARPIRVVVAIDE